ncbi:MAG: hypothetical protein K0R99_3302 [Microbacterium sp.]|uniref:nitroreductase family protein n=1 Tax=Microbacterium sp. TaxID=51671 RepID=UPI00262BD43D|nr:nitroreductase [Microbacterium sp.]MDF2561856.1 hypothetical protein [Microbacterium sp.]
MGTVDEIKYRFKLRIRAHREFRADQRRYLRFTAPEERILSSPSTDKAVETQATKDYHRVEKALALNSVKRPFGDALGRRLDAVLPLLQQDTDLYAHTASARRALDLWNNDGVVDDEVSPPSGDGTFTMPRADLQEFFTTRHSVRNFDASRTVSRDLLEEAIDLASRTPSVCNRQSWRVYLATEPETTQRLLTHQNGNSGFGGVPVVALITSDARLFAGVGERNQGWIDGGLFAMSFVWALHGLGLSSCMLNMSVRNDRADALRAAFGIPDHELIVMQIAIGYPAPGHRIARSPRRPRSEIAVFLDEA